MGEGTDAYAGRDDWLSEIEEDYVNGLTESAKTMGQRIIAMRRRYMIAEKAKVGTMIECPFCGKKHKKTTYHKKFCSNMKTAGVGNCKDRYWNFADDTRRNRMLDESGIGDELLEIINDLDNWEEGGYQNEKVDAAEALLEAFESKYNGKEFDAFASAGVKGTATVGTRESKIKAIQTAVVHASDEQLWAIAKLLK